MAKNTKKPKSLEIPCPLCSTKLPLTRTTITLRCPGCGASFNTVNLVSELSLREPSGPVFIDQRMQSFLANAPTEKVLETREELARFLKEIDEILKQRAGGRS